MGQFCGFFPITCVTGALSLKQNGSIQVEAQFELHLNNLNPTYVALNEVTL